MALTSETLVILANIGPGRYLAARYLIGNITIAGGANTGAEIWTYTGPRFLRVIGSTTQWNNFWTAADGIITGSSTNIGTATTITPAAARQIAAVGAIAVEVQIMIIGEIAI